MYEGRIIDYDPIYKIYKIKYVDNDVEEMTQAEVKQHHKVEQKFTPESVRTMQNFERGEKAMSMAARQECYH